MTTRVTLELGGKAPGVIAADADIDAAVAGTWPSGCSTAARSAPLTPASTSTSSVRTSGWGREMGPYSTDAYTEVKGVWMHYRT